MKAWAVVPAAGPGSRLGAGPPKPLRVLAGRPLISWTIEALRAAPSVSGIVVACSGETAAAVRATDSGIDIVDGGETRQVSVRVALEALRSGGAEHVIVHDAARPLVTVEVVERVCSALDNADAVIPAVPVSDTLKRVERDRVVETVVRDGIWRAQTPQGFRYSVLLEAHERALEEHFAGTDDAALVQRLGVAIVVVPGDETNLKVTSDSDLRLAEAILGGQLG